MNVFEYINMTLSYLVYMSKIDLIYLFDTKNKIFLKSMLPQYLIKIFYPLSRYSYIYKIDKNFKLKEEKNKFFISPIIEKIFFLNKTEKKELNINKYYSNNFFLDQILYMENLNNMTHIIIEKNKTCHKLKISEYYNKRLIDIYNI